MYESRLFSRGKVSTRSGRIEKELCGTEDVGDEIGGLERLVGL
jgi:hypothetical protein